jgi:hypothetical protein
VGFTSIEEVQLALAQENGIPRLLFPEEQTQIDRIKEEADMADCAYRQFQRQQVEKGSVTALDKAALRGRLDSLNNELHQALAKIYGVKTSGPNFDNWLESHKPFHWIVDFYGIMTQGGFGVIIGNPPYVEYSQVRQLYKIIGYQTINSGNLYSYTIERCITLLEVKGRFSMIVQLPIVCTDRMQPLQCFILQNCDLVCFANFDDRPAKLFDGLEHIRASIFVLSKSGNPHRKRLFSTKYNRWYLSQRPSLFHTLEFTEITGHEEIGSIPKVGSTIQLSILNKIHGFTPLGIHLLRKGNQIYFHNAPQYWVRALDYAPYFWNSRDGEKVSSQIKSLHLSNYIDAQTITAILNSSLFYWWFIVFSDCRHLNMREIENFPINLTQISISIKQKLAAITITLMDDYKKNSTRKETLYKTTGQVIYDEYYPRLSKSIIDKIDHLLSKHYGLSEEELDYLINYDIKYRLGAESDKEEE